MIIKITVNDNDYGEFLEWLGKTICEDMYRLFPPINPDNTVNEKDLIKHISKRDRFEALIHPVSCADEKLLPDGEFFVIHCFKEIVENRANKFNKKHPEFELDVDYLMEQLNISIIDKFIEKWENGENLYIFTRHNIYIMQ